MGEENCTARGLRELIPSPIGAELIFFIIFTLDIVDKCENSKEWPE